MIRAALLAVLALFVFLVPPAPGARATDDSAYRQLNLFGDVFELVRARYAKDVDGTLLMNAAINGMLAALDPHSAWMDAASYADMQERTSGEFGGLGIEVRMEEGLVKVVRPMEDAPAIRAGILAGDLITALDGKPVLGLALSDAVDLMRGRVNTTIELTVRREGVPDEFKVSVTRAVIRTPSVLYHAEGNAAYIRITSFSEQTESGIKRAMADLTAELGDKFEGVIMDLRDNPGGLLDQSVAATEAFLDGGEVVLTRGRDPNNVQRFTARRGDLSEGKPMIVIINGGSASASEIVAGALQDHKRAIILGTQSFGKGSVQTILPMGEYGAMRLTTSRYYTPSGRSIQATGVTPDVIVEQARIEPLFPNPADEAAAAAADNKSESGAPAAQTPPPDYQLARAVDLLHSLAVYQRAATIN